MPEPIMDNTVLVVDDIAANRHLLGETLEPRGYEVLLANNGEMALKVASKAHPNVILLDVNMPDMDGYEACRRLKAAPETREIPVIFVTANDDPESLVQGFRAGGVDYITKPFKEQEVLMRVETHLKIHSLKSALRASNRELADKNAALETEVERRREAESRANEANEAKSRFLSFISHEMRSPLNAIIGFSEELVDALEAETQTESRADAQSIHRSGHHLLSLINNLLELSKIEAGKMDLDLEEFCPRQLIHELARDMEPLIRKRANTLRIEEESLPSPMRADPTKTKQALMNLISNASKFTENGSIAIKLSHENGEGVRIDVTDSGIGMNSEEMGRLFEAYQQANEQTSKRYGGTGLGLAISRQYCRLMGGDLSVASAPGRGSTFSIRLPIRVSSE